MSYPKLISILRTSSVAPTKNTGSFFEMNGSRYQRYIVLLNKKLIYYDEIRNITDAIAAIHKTIKLIQTYRAMLSLFHPWSFTLKFKDVFSMFIICCIKTFPREKFAKSQLFDLFNHVHIQMDHQDRKNPEILMVFQLLLPFLSILIVTFLYLSKRQFTLAANSFRI